jgi:hypothetical protein
LSVLPPQASPAQHPSRYEGRECEIYTCITAADFEVGFLCKHGPPRLPQSLHDATSMEAEEVTTAPDVDSGGTSTSARESAMQVNAFDQPCLLYAAPSVHTAHHIAEDQKERRVHFSKVCRLPRHACAVCCAVEIMHITSCMYVSPQGLKSAFSSSTPRWTAGSASILLHTMQKQFRSRAVSSCSFVNILQNDHVLNRMQELLVRSISQFSRHSFVLVHTKGLLIPQIAAWSKSQEAQFHAPSDLTIRDFLLSLVGAR